MSKSNEECEHNGDLYANTPEIKIAAIPIEMTVFIHRMDFWLSIAVGIAATFIFGVFACEFPLCSYLFDFNK